MKHIMYRTDDAVGTDGDIPLLVRLLGSPAGMTRLRAREALVAAGAAAEDPLIEALVDDRDIVRWEAAKALMSMASPRATTALVAALEDDEADIRWLAAEALIELRGASLGPLLAALEQHPDSTWLREGAHHVLKYIRDRTIQDRIAPVVAALEHHDAELVIPLVVRDARAALDLDEMASHSEKESSS